MTTHVHGGEADRSRWARLWARFLERPLPLVLAAALLLQVVALVAMRRFDPVLVAGAVLLGVALPAGFRSTSRMLALLIVLLMVLPRLPWPFLPVTYNDFLAAPLLAFAIFLALRDRLDRGDLSLPHGAMGPLWAMLAVWLVVCIAQGVLLQADSETLWHEAFRLGLYGLFFVALDGLRRPADFRLLLAALIVGFLGVSVEYVLVAASQGASAVGSGRIISRQANLAVAVCPFLVALFLTGGRRSWVWLLGLFPAIVVALLAQQRSLFIALPFSLLLVGVLSLRAPAVRRRRLGGLALGAVLTGVLAWNAVGSFQALQGGPSVTEGITSRTEEVSGSAAAPALLIRFVSFSHVLREKIAERPILGWGFGDRAGIPVLRGANYTVMRVDNAYLTLAWKAGLVGLVLFLLLWAMVLWRAWLLARHPSREAQVVALGVAGCLSANLVLSLAAALFTHYRYNAIWAIMMAAVVMAPIVYGRRATGDAPDESSAAGSLPVER